MKTLLVAATPFEIAPFVEELGRKGIDGGKGCFRYNNDEIHIVISGVGMVATSYALTKALAAQSYDFVVQAGVGGSFDRSIDLGTVVLITEERFGDLGAEDRYNFHDIFDLELEQLGRSPFNDGKLLNPLNGFLKEINLPHVTGLTVNMVTGSDFTTALRQKKYSSQLESMEGGAFHYVCLLENVPFAQIRSISNYVEARDKSKWQMKIAIQRLNEWLTGYLLA